jgi:DNA-binding PadR family transcriptional regulator
MENEPLQSLPLTEATFFILLSLVPGSKHGYAILKDVETLSNRRVTLSTSTLYSALQRLGEQGLIARIDDDVQPPANPGLPRKAYILTEAGRKILESEMARLQHLFSVGQQRLRNESGSLFFTNLPGECNP